MPTETDTPVTPALTFARMDWIAAHPNGEIHTDKTLPNGKELTSAGTVRGSGLQIGLAVEIQKDNKKKTWGGTIISGPHCDDGIHVYWKFTVTNKINTADPDQDDTVTVTVTNPNTTPTTSPPIATTPQPSVVP